MSERLSYDGPAFQRPRSSRVLPVGALLRWKATAFGGQSSDALETGRTRLLVASLVFVCAFAVIGVRLLDLALFTGAPQRIAPQAGFAHVEPQVRADIVDRNGVVLATTLPRASLHANPREIRNPKFVAAQLSAILPDLSEGEVSAKLAMDRSFIWIKRGLSPRQQYQINRLGVPGLSFREEERRTYPQGELTAHIVGFTDVDNQGLAGLEQGFDELLSGSKTPLRLSLDLRVQHILTDELSRSMEEFRAIGAAGVVMDAHTGEIVAMASLPSFDPNQPGSASSDSRFNRATLGTYEMGSVFKIFSTAAALDSGEVALYDNFDVSDPIRAARFTIRDYRPKEGKLSVPEIFMHSSNIGTVHLAMKTGTEIQRSALARLGLTTPMSLELPETGTPQLPTPWREISTMTVSYGHGLSVTPVQLTAGVAATINGGLMPKPTVLARDDDALVPNQRVFSERTSRDMRRLMRLVVEHGTGGNADAEGYLVGGKTGTANKQVGGTYQRNARISSFVGAFPMDEPRYVVFAMVDEPKGHSGTFGYATGGWVAAPVVHNVVSRMAPMLGIQPRPHTITPPMEEHPLLLHAVGEDFRIAAQ